MSSNHQILEACKTGDIPTLSSLLTGSLRKDADTAPMLRAAARTNQTSVTRFLFDLEVDKSTAASLITRELILDALAGGRNAYEALWEMQPSVINYDLGHAGNALTNATMSNNVELVEFLLSKGADPNKSHMGYHSAIEIAAGYASPEIVKLLLENGAKVDGTEALLSAVRKARAEVLRMLCESGADVNAILNRDGKLTPGEKDCKGATALQIAASQGRADCVSVLLEFGADKEAKRLDGRTPLKRAVEGMHIQVIWILKNSKSRGK